MRHVLLLLGLAPSNSAGALPSRPPPPPPPPPSANGSSTPDLAASFDKHAADPSHSTSGPDERERRANVPRSEGDEHAGSDQAGRHHVHRQPLFASTPASHCPDATPAEVDFYHREHPEIHFNASNCDEVARHGYCSMSDVAATRCCASCAKMGEFGPGGEAADRDKAKDTLSVKEIMELRRIVRDVKHGVASLRNSTRGRKLYAVQSAFAPSLPNKCAIPSKCLDEFSLRMQQKEILQLAHHPFSFLWGADQFWHSFVAPTDINKPPACHNSDDSGRMLVWRGANAACTKLWSDGAYGIDSSKLVDLQRQLETLKTVPDEVCGTDSAVVIEVSTSHAVQFVLGYQHADAWGIGETKSGQQFCWAGHADGLIIEAGPQVGYESSRGVGYYVFPDCACRHRIAT